MELIKSEDTCIISRESGYDEYDQPISDFVYSGACRYQQGVQAYMGISQRNSVVFIKGDVRVLENDICTVKLSNGIERKGVVKTVRNVKLPLSGSRTTRIELAQDTETAE